MIRCSHVCEGKVVSSNTCIDSVSTYCDKKARRAYSGRHCVAIVIKTCVSSVKSVKMVAEVFFCKSRRVAVASRPQGRKVAGSQDYNKVAVGLKKNICSY